MSRMRPDAQAWMRETYSDEQIAEIYPDITTEDHIFFICPRCRLIYMWLPCRSFMVFQCVVRGETPYDDKPTGEEILFPITPDNGSA